MPQKKTKREIFLDEMGKTVPWTEIIEEIEPYYYKNRTDRPAPRDKSNVEDVSVTNMVYFFR